MSNALVIDVASVVERQKVGRFLIGLVAISWIITFFDGFDMNVISFAAPALASAYHLDKLMLGNVFSAGLIGTLIGGFLFGYLGDKIGRRPAILIATVLFSVLTLGFALATGYRSLLVLRLIDGIAIGGMLPLAWALNIEYAPRRFRSTIVTVVMIGYSLGTSLGGPIAIWLIPRFGWQSAFVFGGSLSLVAALVLILYLPESARFLVSTGRRPDLVVRLLRRLSPDAAIPDNARFILADEATTGTGFSVSLLFAGELRLITPLLWIAYIASSFVAFTFANWMPTVFEAVGLSRTTAAAATSVNALFGALGGLILMRFTDRLGAIAITIMPLLAVPLLLLLGLADLGQTVFLGANTLVALFLVGGHFGLHSIAGIFYPSEYRANGTGWATSVAKVGSILGPFVTGLILSTSLPPRDVFAVLSVCPVICVVCLFIIGRLHSRILRRERAATAAVAERLPVGHMIGQAGTP